MEYELKYPHLSDINYPDVESVEVFDYDYDEYDWSRWTDNVKLKLCNVPWDSDGSNAVNFVTIEARDEWFDNLEGHSIELKTMFHEMPSQTLKVPIPFPVALTYNYLMVDTPVMPTKDNPLDYETNIMRYNRTFWYIMDVKSSAPNTTELLLLQDYWTNYINEVGISYMMLRRGHAPMGLVHVEDYLSNPYDNRDWLLADDVNFHDSTNIKGQQFIPFGNGKKYICFASTMSLVNFETMEHAVTVIGDNTAPSYADIAPANMDKSPRPTNQSQGYGGNVLAENRTYEDFSVSGWNWNTGHRNFTNNDVSLEYYTNAGISADVDVYAVEAEYAEQFIRDMHWTYPQWFGCVVAAFDMSEDMFGKGLEITVRVYAENTSTQRTYTAWKANRVTDHAPVELHVEKDDFNYPEEYDWITKLYTFPYCHLELSEYGGRTIQVRVEDLTENACLRFKTCLAFPWIKFSAFFEGIGGDASNVTYVWKTVSGENRNITIKGDDWQKLLFEHDIPTFAIYQMAEERYGVDHANKLAAQRASALQMYRNMDDAANTQYFNQYYDASTDYANKVDVNKLNYDVSYATDERQVEIVKKQNELSVKAAQLDSLHAAIMTRNSYVKLHEDYLADRINIDATASINQQYTASMAFVSEVGGLFTAGIQLATGAAIGMNGAPYQGIQNMSSGFQTLVGVPVTHYQASAAINQSQSSADFGKAILDAKYLNAEKKLSWDLLDTSGLGVVLDNSDSGGHVINNPSTAGYNYEKATLIEWYQNGIADKTFDEVQKPNLEDTKDVYDNNAGATRSIARHNADEIRKMGIRQAKRTMEQARNDALAGYLDSQHGMHVQHGVYSGNGTPDVYRWRGVQVKVRTQPDGAIRQAGDQMLRYGWFVNQNWEFDTFNIMEHFTYWEVSEIWLTGGVRGVPEQGQETIKRMLRNGVTVWHNPNDIGTVSIYDNKPNE